MVTWRDRLRQALRARHDEATATALERRYGQAFPAAYRQDVAPALAVQGIPDLAPAAPGGARLLRPPPPAGAHHRAPALRPVPDRRTPAPIADAPGPVGLRPRR